MIVNISLNFRNSLGKPVSFPMSERWGAVPNPGDIIQFDQFWLFLVQGGPKVFRLNTPVWKDGLNLGDHIVEIEAEIAPTSCRDNDIGGLMKSCSWTAEEFEPLWRNYRQHKRRFEAALDRGA